MCGFSHGIPIIRAVHPNSKTQADLRNLFGAVRKLRSASGYENLTLSDEWQQGEQAGHEYRGRIRFGLLRGKHGEAGDRAAASACYKRVLRAIRGAGFVVVSPKKFDPSTGLAGLETWGGQVRL